MSSDPKGLGAVFDAHTDAEFRTRDIEATMATMGSNPHVNHVPVMTGGFGPDGVRSFYETFHRPLAARREDHARLAYGRRGPAGGRADPILHPRLRDAGDSARHQADWTQSDMPHRGDRGIRPRQQDHVREYLLGPGDHAGAAWAARSVGFAGMRSRAERARVLDPRLPANTLILKG
jgi:hypothetical protein